MRPLAVGALLTIAIAVAGAVVWGQGSVVAIASFGMLATIVQVVAEGVAGPAIKRDLPFATVLKRWGVGMTFRFVGIVVLAVAVALNPELFPPLPAATAYLGVLLPLLFVETRLLR